MLESYDMISTQDFDSLDIPSTKIKLLKGIQVLSLDTETQTLSLSNGRSLQYEKVLLATGGTPKT